MNSTYILLLPSVEGSVSHFPIPNSLSCTLWRLGLFAKSAPCLEGLSGSSSGTEKIIHQPWNPLNNKGFKDLIFHQIPSEFFNVHHVHPWFIILYWSFWICGPYSKFLGDSKITESPWFHRPWTQSSPFGVLEILHRVADLRAPLSLPKIHLGGSDSRDVVDRCHGFENEMST